MLSLERVREQLAVSDLVLWSGAGQALGTAGASRFEFSPERPAATVLRSVRANRVLAQIEGLEEGGEAPSTGPETAMPPRIKVLALVIAPGFGIGTEPRYLQATSLL